MLITPCSEYNHWVLRDMICKGHMIIIFIVFITFYDEKKIEKTTRC